MLRMENSRKMSHSSKTYRTSNEGQYLFNPKQYLLIPIQTLWSSSHLDSGADKSGTAPLQSSVSTYTSPEDKYALTGIEQSETMLRKKHSCWGKLYTV